jgi:hypothetical protein
MLSETVSSCSHRLSGAWADWPGKVSSEHGTVLDSYAFYAHGYHGAGATIRHPDIRVKHCTYGHSVAILLNPRGVTTVSHKCSLTVARHATVVVAVPFTVHYPINCKINIYF